MSRNLVQERANLAQFVAAHGGRAFIDVPVSGDDFGWASEAPQHAVDAVWFETGGAGEIVPLDESARREFRTLVASGPAHLISPRGYADRTAFGMLIACRGLFSRPYPDHQLLRAIALSESASSVSSYLSER